MAPWDPIRDAVQASSGPIQKGSIVPRNTTPSPTRTTSLVIPQNRASNSPQSSTTPRSSTLAMLLNDATTYRSSPSPVMPTRGAGQLHGGASLDLLMNPVSPSRKPATREKSHSPPPVAAKIPYNPTRISAPGSVLVPLTATERRTFSNPVNSLRRALAATVKAEDSGSYSPSQPQQESGGYSPSQPQASEPSSMDYEMARKRKREEEDMSPSTARPTKRQNDRDDVLVAHHYNARPEVGVRARTDSPIFGLKAFNNWVKSVLIQKMAVPPLQSSPSKRIPSRNGGGRGGGNNPLSGRVLDIGCGKGGDLRKWQKARVRDYVGLDIATVSVNQARDRWGELRGERFDAFFCQADCYSDAIGQHVPRQHLETLFDVVTMQFCMHYAFESERKVRTMLDNVARYLRPGGRFVGTVPNADVLKERLDEAGGLEFGNAVYRVLFDRGFEECVPVYGHRYMFFLQDAVEDVPEYVVYWDNFVSVAEEYGLRLVYKEEFHNIYAEEAEDPEFGALLKVMKVVDANGESAMDEDQWDAANVYLAFAFEKM